MIVFSILLVLLVYVTLVFYIGWSGYTWLKPRFTNRWFKWIYALTLIVVSCSFLLGQFFEFSILDLIGAYWLAIFYLLILVLPPVHLIIWLLRLFRISSDHVTKWSGVAVLILLFAFILYGSFNAYNPTVRTYSISIAKQAEPHDHLNIVMAADTHFGLLSNRGHAARMVQAINQLEPDLVLIPGDLVDDEIDTFVSQNIAEVLSQIEAPLGVYASLGNHDRHPGPTQELIETIEKGNIRVLYDEGVSIEGLTLIGRKDRIEPDRAPLQDLMNDIDHTSPIFLLDHQPYNLDIAQQLGVDLMVSGHTHRGQVFPGSWFTSRIFENDWGHLQRGSFHSIVTSGYGFWGPPLRIGTRSEVVQILVTFNS